MPDRAGALRERLVIQTHVPPALVVTSLTRSSTTATVTMPVPHGFATADYVRMAGALPAGYTGKFQITVTGATTFTYLVTGSLTTPATGTITATYVSDAQGGRAHGWMTYAGLEAESVPLRTVERLQLEAIQAGVYSQFLTRMRTDLDPSMRVLWTPAWPPGAPQHTLTITGVRPDADSYDPSIANRFIVLDCVEAAQVAV